MVPGADISGEWELRVDFLHGARVHRLAIEQHGVELSGRQRAEGLDGPLVGRLEGDRVQLLVTVRHEASTLCYCFDGEIRDGEMRGTAVLGAATDQHGGIVNRGQFGADGGGRAGSLRQRRD